MPKPGKMGAHQAIPAGTPASLVCAGSAATGGSRELGRPAFCQLGGWETEPVLVEGPSCVISDAPFACRACRRRPRSVGVGGARGRSQAYRGVKAVRRHAGLRHSLWKERICTECRPRLGPKLEPQNFGNVEASRLVRGDGRGGVFCIRPVAHPALPSSWDNRNKRVCWAGVALLMAPHHTAWPNRGRFPPTAWHPPPTPFSTTHPARNRRGDSLCARIN